VSVDDDLLTTRVDALLTDLGSRRGVVVAFSGGVDSALVLAAAVRALGPARVLAATAVSPALPAAERGPAAAYAAELGVGHEWVETHEIEREGYRANAGSRCYFCKAEMVEVLGPLAADRGWVVATGTNADDALARFRPGIRAADERGAIAPLRDAGLTKEQVRAQSRAWGLSTWDKPAAACLSSRIAYGITITPSVLARVERAKAAVRADWAAADGPVPLTDLRVRDLGEGRARLEVDAAALASLTADPGRQGSALDAVRDSGFDAVELQAFRSGSMNDALTRH